jgi:hydroxymethylpyrimidine/phosphomethylpyrimidine kinase
VTPPIVLTIAGFDPSSGAGVTADIKTIAARGCYGVACITAMTVQSTLGVRRVQALPPALVRDTLQELARDMTFAAVKIGMLDSREVADEVADFLETHRPPNVVLDPILKSSSGADLLDPTALAILRDRLLPLATVITPNIDEAAALSGRPVGNAEQMRAAAEALHGLGAKAVLITGGHLDPPVDLLSQVVEAGEGGKSERSRGRRPQIHEIPGEKIASTSTHGTGCAFATSLACHLALGRSLRDAAVAAKAYVAEAIRNAYSVGKGTGPLNHMWR